MRETLETGITSPKLPALAERERRTKELLAQPAPPSRHATSAADPASPPKAVLPTPEPLRRPKEPQHSLGPYATNTRSTPSPGKPCAPWLAHRGPARGSFPAVARHLLPGGNLVRIVRTFKPFREPIFLPPDTVLPADAAMGEFRRLRRRGRGR
jgi:hypothetical protein